MVVPPYSRIKLWSNNCTTASDDSSTRMVVPGLIVSDSPCESGRGPAPTGASITTVPLNDSTVTSRSRTAPIRCARMLNGTATMIAQHSANAASRISQALRSGFLVI